MMPETKKVKKSIYRSLLKVTLRFFAALLILVFSLILFIRSSWGQNIIITKVTSYVSEKIESNFSIQKFYLSFSGNLVAEGIYLEDQAKKELLYIGYLSVEVPLYAVLKKKEISISINELSEVRAHVYRNKNQEAFNYAFIINAFASDEEEVETTSNNHQIIFKSGTLKEVSLLYEDMVKEEKHQLGWEEFQVYFDLFNIEENQFEIRKLFLNGMVYDGNIQPSEVTQAIEEPEESLEASTGHLLNLAIKDISLKEIDVRFVQPGETKLTLQIPDFNWSDVALNQREKHIRFDALSWNEVLLHLEIFNENSTQNAQKKPTTTPEESLGSLWPEWNIHFNKVTTQQNNYTVINNSIHASDTIQTVSSFVNTHLIIEDFELQPAEEIRFELKEFSTQFNDFTRIEKFGFQLELAEKNVAITALQLETFNSFVNGNASLAYTDLNFIRRTNKGLYDLHFGIDYSVDFTDFDALLEAFELDLEPALLSNLASSRLNGSISSSGSNIDALEVALANQWNSTKLFGKLGLESLSNPENLSVAIKELQFSSTNEDIHLFLPKSDAYQIPERFSLQATGNYNANTTNITSNFSSDLASFDSKIQLLTKDVFQYNIEFTKANVHLGKLLRQENLGAIHFSFASEGKELALEKAQNTSQLDIESIEIDNIRVKNIGLSSEFNKGIGQVALGVQDSLVQANLASAIVYKNEALQVGWTLQLDGMDLQGLGFSDERIKIKATLSGEVLQEEKGLSFEVNVREMVGLRDKRTYVLHELDVLAQLWKEETNLVLKGDFVDANLQSNANIEHSLESLHRYIENQLSVMNEIAKVEEEKTKNTQERPVVIEAQAKFYDNNFLREVIFPQLEELDTLQMQFSFVEERELLSANIQLPFVEYANNQLKGFEIQGEGNASEFDVKVGFEGLTTSVFAIDATQLKASKNDDAWEVTFVIEDDERLLFNVAFQVSPKEEGLYRLQLHPENLVLNALPWEISAKNKLVFGNQALEASHFSIERNEQKLRLSHELGFEEPHFGLQFSDFKVGTFTSFIKSEKENLASGTIKGDVTLINPFENWGLVSDLQVQGIHVFERLIGDFDLVAEASSASKYNLVLSLEGPEINLRAEGKLNTEGENKRITSSFNLEALSMPLIEFFSTNYIRNSEGKLSASGKFSLLDGETNYQAELKSSKVFFNLRALNADLYLGDEAIELNNKGLFFTKFNLQDANNNSFSLSGSIKNVLTKPQFLLDAEAKNFQLLNSTKADNELYFGTLNFDATAKVRGDIQLPKINLNVQINKNTNLTYVVPQTQLEVVEREGVVVFVNKEIELDVFNQTQQEELKADVRGIDINALVKISPKATINVLLNERTGDNLRVQGGGDLQVNVRPNGTINLSGKYQASEGHFELNLYNLVRRRFTFAPNSSIVWSGDPLNADLDIRAIYNVETSPSTLMAAQLISESPAVQNRYRQQLPFLVYLDVSGEINAPELDFSLDMPSGERAAIGGSVFDRITQINQQEGERSKQVFALLVLNQFYPESGSDGSQGGATALARNNINQALSDQLNTFSNKMLKNSGVVLNFDLNSYTDFQSGAANDRTDLDVSAQKKLFNDRLVVEAGSQINVQGDQRPGESNVALGNVSVEYLLTRDERWKLRGFRRNEYENIIDGQLVFSGIALIFTKEFNEFQELWKSFLSAEDEVQKDEQKVKNETDNTTEEQHKEESVEPTKKNREKAN